MRVTINTDGSFCPVQKVGGFACWIKSDIGTITKTGPIKCANDSQDCEMKAVANAVFILEKSYMNNGKISSIVINSDCQSMVSKIGIRSKNEIGKYIAKAIRDIRNENSPKNKSSFHKFKHVKAHNGTPDARSWVNDWCDRMAKAEMNLQRGLNDKNQKTKEEELDVKTEILTYV